MKKCLIIDVACPFGIRAKDKWKEKIKNYQDLRRELKRIRKLRRVTVVPIVTGALETISKDRKVVNGDWCHMSLEIIA